MKDIKFWDEVGNDHDCLQHTEMDEAIESIIDNYYPRPVPRKIEIIGFKEMEVEINADNHLEALLETIDENYASPDYNEQSNEDILLMEKATIEYLEKIKGIYKPWACEEVKDSKREIDTVKWVNEHAPRWIEDGIKFEETNDNE